MSLAPHLRSSEEGPLLILGALFSAWAWALLGVVTLGLGLLGLLGLFALGALRRAMRVAEVRGSGVRVGLEQLPELHAALQDAAQALELAAAPELYVFASRRGRAFDGVTVLSSRVLAIDGELVAGCTDALQLRFVLGRALGQLAAHHRWRRLSLAPFRALPWLGPAYDRACETTEDLCGLAAAKDVTASMRALAVMATGAKVGAGVELGALRAQGEMAGRFLLATRELTLRRPYLSKRLGVLARAAEPSSEERPRRRSPWAYPLAPLIGWVASGLGATLVITLLGAAVFVGTGALWNRLAPRAVAHLIARVTPEQDDLLVGDDGPVVGSSGEDDDADGKDDSDSSEDPSEDEPPQLDAAPPTKSHGTAPPRHAVERPSTEL